MLSVLITGAGGHIDFGLTKKFFAEDWRVTGAETLWDDLAMAAIACLLDN